MDALNLILAALNAGVTTGASEAVKDLLAGLKKLIGGKFEHNSSAELALEQYENDPMTWKVPLKKALMHAHVEQDKDIIETAQKMMAQIQPQQAAQGKYNVQITGNVQGYAQGDHQQVTMNFGNNPQEK